MGGMMLTINIDMNKKCKRCRKPGVAGTEGKYSDYCMGCIAKMIRKGEIKIPNKEKGK
jgi:hypothetical protein